MRLFSLNIKPCKWKNDIHFDLFVLMAYQASLWVFSATRPPHRVTDLKKNKKKNIYLKMVNWYVTSLDIFSTYFIRNYIGISHNYFHEGYMELLLLFSHLILQYTLFSHDLYTLMLFACSRIRKWRTLI